MDACSRLLSAGGIGYVAAAAGLVAVPLDHEWIAAIAPTLDEAIDFALESDGMQMEDGDMMAVPHLTLEDAIDELLAWASGRMTRVVVGREAASVV